MIDPVTRAKTHIVRGKQQVTDALLEQIDSENLPREYGGTCDQPLGQAREERMLWQQVAKVNGEET